MPGRERIVGGLSCSDVLELLSDYIDNATDSGTRARVEEHLRGCDWCERFGGRFSEVVETLRKQLGTAEPLPSDVAKRLRERLGRR